MFECLVVSMVVTWLSVRLFGMLVCRGLPRDG